MLHADTSYMEYDLLFKKKNTFFPVTIPERGPATFPTGIFQGGSPQLNQGCVGYH